MNSREKVPSFRALTLITTPKAEKKAEEMFSKGAVPVQYRLNAQGTASSEIMDMLGLGSIEKRVLISVMPKTFADVMLGKLHTELKLDTVNSGIAFTIPLVGISNLMLHALAQVSDDKPAQSERKDEVVMTDNKYVLIAAVINRGFSGDVMEAAKKAGAGGGTVVNSRRVGNDETSGFWGLNVQDEKEIVLILADAESKVDIMQKISENCGMSSEAKGIVTALPIDSVIGFPGNK